MTMVLELFLLPGIFQKGGGGGAAIDLEAPLLLD